MRAISERRSAATRVVGMVTAITVDPAATANSGQDGATAAETRNRQRHGEDHEPDDHRRAGVHGCERRNGCQQDENRM